MGDLTRLIDFVRLSKNSHRSSFIKESTSLGASMHRARRRILSLQQPLIAPWANGFFVIFVIIGFEIPPFQFFICGCLEFFVSVVSLEFWSDRFGIS